MGKVWPGRGERIRTLRELREWTQIELASKADTNQSTISDWEADDKIAIRRGNLRLLAEALGTTVEYLKTGRAGGVVRESSPRPYIPISRDVAGDLGRLEELAGAYELIAPAVAARIREAARLLEASDAGQARRREG